MMKVERNGNDFVVPVGLLADAFGASEMAIREGMQTHQITSQSETGIGEDEGRWRLTFFRQDKACRFIVDDRGQVLKRACFPICRRRGTETRTEAASGRE